MGDQPLPPMCLGWLDPTLLAADAELPVAGAVPLCAEILEGRRTADANSKAERTRSRPTRMKAPTAGKGMFWLRHHDSPARAKTQQNSASEWSSFGSRDDVCGRMRKLP